jgi:uncharacterized iron-regulated membrane protein
MKLRTVLFWIHLLAGTIAGIVILTMAVTGTLLTFQQSVLKTIEGSQRFVVPPAGASRIDLDSLMARVREAVPDAQITTITLDSDPAASAAVGLGTQATIFVNPYTGDVLGSGSARARAFYRTVTNVHRWLAVEGEHRATARAITGACNTAFLVLAMTGLYLWWPRQWTARHVAAVMLFRRGLHGKARDFNWHNVIGFWCAPVLIVLTASGMVISYPWASNLVYTLTGSPRPATPARGGGATPGADASANRSDPSASRNASQAEAVPLANLMAHAEERLPTWRTMIVRLPQRAGGQVAFSMSDRHHWNSFARSTLALDGASGAEIRWEPYAGTSRGQKVRGWLRFAHTGELGGIPGEALAGLASAGGAFLVWTGIALALRRLSAWRARRKPDAVSETPQARVA